MGLELAVFYSFALFCLDYELVLSYLHFVICSRLSHLALMLESVLNLESRIACSKKARSPELPEVDVSLVSICPNYGFEIFKFLIFKTDL